MPDIYDAAKYDTIHNQHLGLDLKPVYKVGRALTSGVCGLLALTCGALASLQCMHDGDSAAHLHRSTLRPVSTTAPPCLPPLSPQVAKCLAGVVVPNEYGIHPAGKLRIGSMICRQASRSSW